MSVAPETLDTEICAWCADNGITTIPESVVVPAWFGPVALCKTHADEALTDHSICEVFPVANKPKYTLLETYANPMTGEYTIKELETAARYGAPYPVCGDLTTVKRVGKSWVGHDPSGEQY